MSDTTTQRKTKITPTPHDAAFKQFLTNPTTARDFIELHLPADLLALCDLRTLRLESGSFVEENLRAYYSDVLYSLKTRAGEGYIHVLIEHQSTPDRHMAFRLLRYAIAAMQRHLDAGHKSLPLVIPLLFYTGKRTPYPWSTNWLELFVSPATAQELYSSSFPLVDVSVIPDNEIMNHRSMAALTLLQKHIHQRDLSEILDRLATLLVNEHITRQQLASLINYLVYAGEASDAHAFVRELALKAPQHEDQLMTIAQQLEQRGIEKGLAKGIEQGIEQGIERGIEQGIELGEQRGIDKGRKEEAFRIARTMLQNGLDRSTVMSMTGLTEAELAQIRH